MLYRIKQLFSRPDAHQRLSINAYCTVAELPKLAFGHVLQGRRDAADPALAPHLNDCMHQLAAAAAGRMTPLRYHVIRHLQRVRQHVSLSIDDSAKDSFAAWAEAANAILLMDDGRVCDPRGRLLLAANGADVAIDPKAAAVAVPSVPYLPPAWQRKARSEAQLAASQIVVPASLPPLVCEPELHLRSAEDVLRRMLALFVVAIRAEALAGGQAIAVDELKKRFPPAFAGLTDAERAFLAEPAPDSQQVTQFLWRYEAILVLQWVLGLQPTLPSADAICDVAAISRAVIERGTEGLRKQLAMRAPTEILDALDLHYRMHWATRQAILKKTAAPAVLNDSVLQQRHLALNWLVHFEDRDWDDVDTPT